MLMLLQILAEVGGTHERPAKPASFVMLPPDETTLRLLQRAPLNNAPGQGQGASGCNNNSSRALEMRTPVDMDMGVGVNESRSKMVLERLKYHAIHLNNNFLTKATLQASSDGRPGWVRCFTCFSPPLHVLTPTAPPPILCCHGIGQHGTSEYPNWHLACTYACNCLPNKPPPHFACSPAPRTPLNMPCPQPPS